MNDFRELMINELATSFYAIDEKEIEAFIEAILKAKKIFAYACGREGLMLKAFAMRLHHLGFEVHVVGDVTVPAIGLGDLMLVICGPGYLSTVMVLVDIAKKAGAKVIGMTANKEGDIYKYCDHMVYIPAQTMAVKADEVKSNQPMGAIFKQAQLLIEEYMVVRLSEILSAVKMI